MNIFTKKFVPGDSPIKIDTGIGVMQFSMKVNASSTAELTGGQTVGMWPPSAVSFDAGEGVTYNSDTTPLNGLILTVLTGTVDVTMIMRES